MNVNITDQNFNNSSLHVDGIINELNSILTPLTPLGIHLLATVGIFIGTFSCFLGGKCTKATFLLAGFVVGFSATALISHRAHAEANVLLVASLIIGLIVGLLSACLVRVSQAIITTSAATLITILFIRTGMFSPLDPGQDYIVWLILIVFILACAWLVYVAFEIVVVFVTAVGGSLIITVSFIHFLPDWNFNPITMLSYPTKMPECTTIECISIFVIWGLISCAGTIYQWRLWKSEDGNVVQDVDSECELKDITGKLNKKKKQQRRRKTDQPKSSKIRRESRTRRKSGGGGSLNCRSHNKKSSKKYQRIDIAVV
jgi:hypothetical protein